MTKINWMAIIVLVIVHQALGFLWYSPYVLGNPWMEMIGIAPEDIEAAHPGPVGIAIAASLALNVTLAWLFTRLYVTSMISGLWIAFVCWLGFFFLNSAMYAAFEGEARKLVLISGGEALAAFLISGAVLGAWVKRVESVRGIPA
jgi:hypothetical protein